MKRWLDQNEICYGSCFLGSDQLLHGIRILGMQTIVTVLFSDASYFF